MTLPSNDKIRSKFSPGDAIYSGGNFATGAIAVDSALPYIVVVNIDSVAWSVSFVTKTNSIAGPYTVQPGSIVSWPTKNFAQALAPLPTGGTATNFQYFYSQVPMGTSGVSNSVVGNGGSTTPSTISTALNVGTSYANYYLTVAPPTGKRWRIWAVFAQIFNDCVVGQNLNVKSVVINLGRGSVLYGGNITIGSQFADTPGSPWALAQYEFGIFALVPTGFSTLNVPGAADSAILGNLPFELVIEPNVNIQVGVNAEFAFGSDVAYLALVPLGVEEPL